MTIDERNGETRVRLGPVEMWLVGLCASAVVGVGAWSVLKLQDISDRVSRIEGRMEYMEPSR
jgi:uncharacterized OsmC-like protein